jgi:uncharacterized protein DUF4235
MKNLLYRLMSLGLSLVSGVLAGAMFKGVWKLIAHEDDAPQATDPQRSWKEILPAVALQGAVFAAVKAAVERGTAQGSRKLARSSPDADKGDVMADTPRDTRTELNGKRDPPGRPANTKRSGRDARLPVGVRRSEEGCDEVCQSVSNRVGADCQRGTWTSASRPATSSSRNQMPAATPIRIAG